MVHRVKYAMKLCENDLKGWDKFYQSSTPSGLAENYLLLTHFYIRRSYLSSIVFFLV